MENDRSNWYIGIIIVLSIWFYISNSNLSEKNIELQDQVSTLESKVEDLKTNLSDYEEALQQANDDIQEAKNSAWETYQDMGDALDSLETVQI